MAFFRSLTEKDGPRPALVEAKGLQEGDPPKGTFGMPQWREGRPYRPNVDAERAAREAVERVTWAFRAVQAIAGKAARLKAAVRRDDRWDGGEIARHPIPPLLNAYPNSYEVGFHFRHRLSSLALLSRKGAFVEVIRTKLGDPVAFHLLPVQYVAPVPGTGGKFVDHFLLEIPGVIRRQLPPEDVVWVRNPHPTLPYESLTPLGAAGLAIDADFAARVYNREFLRNDARPGGIVVVSGQMSDGDAERLLVRLRENSGPLGAGRISLLTAEEGPGGIGGAQYLDTAVSPRDAQYVEMRRETKKEVLGAFGVPESIALQDASGRCVDDQTEALTTRGWVGGRDLREGDTILSLNTATGRLVWGPVREVYRNEGYDGPMWRLKHAHADFLVTPGHKWAVEPRAGQGRKGWTPSTAWELKEVERLTSHDRICAMGAAEASNWEATYSAAFVELVGWAVTEGHYSPNAWTRANKPNRTAPSVRIRQKEGETADRIRACLAEAGAKSLEGRDKNRPDMLRWDVKGEIAAALHAVSPARVLDREFLLALTPYQRELLVQTMIDADGARQAKTASWIFTQKDRAAAEAFVFLATLAGYRTSMREEDAGHGLRRWRVIVAVRKVVKIQRGGLTQQHYSGLVWCPRTDHGTFIARRHGRVIVTGNTFDNADAEERNFWRDTMLDHLELVAAPFDRLDDDPTTFLGFDLSKVRVLQRDAELRRKELREEVAAKLRTLDEYRAEVEGLEPYVEGGDIVWHGNEVPLATTNPDGLPEPPPPPEPPAPEPLALAPAPEPAVPAATNGNGTAPEPADAQPADSPERGQETRPEAKDAKVAFGPYRVDAKQLRRRRRELDRKLAAWERVAAKTFSAFLERQKRVTLQKLNGPKAKQGTRHFGSGDPSRSPTVTKARIDPADVWARDWDRVLVHEYLEPLLLSIHDDFGQDAFDRASARAAKRAQRAGVEFKADRRWNPDSSRAARLIAERGNQIVGANQATYDAIVEQLAEGEDAGETIEELADRIESVFGEADRSRAVMIARTETVAAANAGSLEGAGQAGAATKTWLATDDDRTREAHEEADGQTVALDDPFTLVNRDGSIALMMHPGDPEGPAEQVVNCRCVQTYAFDDDEEPLLDFEDEDVPFDEVLDELAEGGEPE